MLQNSNVPGASWRDDLLLEFHSYCFPEYWFPLTSVMLTRSLHALVAHSALQFIKGGKIRTGDGHYFHPSLSPNPLWHLDLAMS